MQFTVIYLCIIFSEFVKKLCVSETTNDFCRSETFEASCSPNEVILITSAVFGRMKLNRCVQRDQRIGCFTDVLTSIDQVCSGRHTCHIELILLLPLVRNPCFEMVGYFHISHRCVPGKSLYLITPGLICLSNPICHL